jgi:hypothetical protein
MLFIQVHDYRLISIYIYICQVFVTRYGVGLMIGFTEILQLVTTSNNKAIANLNTLQITTAQMIHSLL